jgi:phosphoribosylglycinamide formyltransferase-1
LGRPDFFEVNGVEMSVFYRPRIAVLASGRGSNFDSILASILEGRLDAEIVAVISDRAKAPVLAKAEAAGIPAIFIPPVKASAGAGEIERRQLHEKSILEALLPYRPRFLVLGGYMRILTPYLIEAFRCERGYSRMVNIHPSLLPAFPGVRSYAQAFEYGVKWTGVTVHLVEATVDGGPICAQEAFSIAHCRSVEEVEKLGLAIEHRLYPETLNWVLSERFTLESRNPEKNGADFRGAPGLGEINTPIGMEIGAKRGERYYVCQN